MEDRQDSLGNTSKDDAVIKNVTYIEWEDEPEARVSFWGRMRVALNEILPANG